MAVDEAARRRLYNRLDQVLGTEEAGLLMELLPAVPWTDLATKHDLEVLSTELRREMHVLGVELRSEMHELRTSLRGEIRELAADLRAEVKVGAAAARTETRTQARQLFLSMVGLQMTAASLAVALSRLL